MNMVVYLVFYNLLYPISLNPEFSYSYDSDSEKYPMVNTSIQDFEFIINSKYQYEKIKIEARTGYHLVDGTLAGPSDFTKAQGMQYFVQDKGLQNQKNYWISDMKLNFGDQFSYFYINKWDKHWGYGLSSLTISNKIPSFFHFGFNKKINESLTFEYFHGKLKSNMDDSIYANYYDFVGYNPIDINRNIVGHRLEWAPFKNFYISISELIVYANRELELTYMLPFVPFFPIQSYIGETDNVLMNADLKYLINKNMYIYTSILIDEWSPVHTFKLDNNNWFGYLSGISVKDFIINSSDFNLEYTWSDHRIYRHRFPVNDYYSWGYPVGFWAGPHANEINLNYTISFNKCYVNIEMSDARRGRLTHEMLVDQYSSPSKDRRIYKRFDGATERKQIVSISVISNILNKLNLKISYSYIDWDNAGFDPVDWSIENDDIVKHSLGLGMHYSY